VREARGDEQRVVRANDDVAAYARRPYRWQRWRDSHCALRALAALRAATRHGGRGSRRSQAPFDFTTESENR
jgi:hypothetical protein